MTMDHEIINVNDEENGRHALRIATKRYDGRLGVTRNFDPSVDGEHVGNVIVGHNEYAIYRL